VRQVSNLQRLYRDAWSTEHKTELILLMMSSKPARNM